MTKTPETSAEESWYIIKQASEQCQILSKTALESLTDNQEASQPTTQWGPFKAKNQAIAKRVGLIRAGKCQPS